jgi:hypothetical protein
MSNSTAMALKMPTGKAIGESAKDAAIATLGAMAATFATTFAPEGKPKVKSIIEGATLIGGVALASASSNGSVKALGLGMAVMSALSLARTGLNTLQGVDDIAGIKIPDGLKKFANKLVPQLNGMEGDVSISPEEQTMLMGLFGGNLGNTDETVYPAINGSNNFRFAGLEEPKAPRHARAQWAFAV